MVPKPRPAGRFARKGSDRALIAASPFGRVRVLDGSISDYLVTNKAVALIRALPAGEAERAFALWTLLHQVTSVPALGTFTLSGHASP
jgi:hypothetical protein